MACAPPVLHRPREEPAHLLSTSAPTCRCPPPPLRAFSGNNAEVQHRRVLGQVLGRAGRAAQRAGRRVRRHEGEDGLPPRRMLKATPVPPTFIEARDALLAVVFAASPPPISCVQDAFAFAAGVLRRRPRIAGPTTQHPAGRRLHRRAATPAGACTSTTPTTSATPTASLTQRDRATPKLTF